MKLKLWHWLLLAAIALAAVVAPFACPWPDGFEHVAEKLGFAEGGEGAPLVRSPLPDYSTPGVGSERLGTSVAGLVGIALMFALVYGLSKRLARRGEADDG